MIKGKFRLVLPKFIHESSYFFFRCCTQQVLFSTWWNGEDLALVAYGYLGEAPDNRWENEETKREDPRWCLNHFSKVWLSFLCISLLFLGIGVSICQFFVFSKTASNGNNHICTDMHLQFSFSHLTSVARSCWKEISVRMMSVLWLPNFFAHICGRMCALKQLCHKCAHLHHSLSAVVRHSVIAMHAQLCHNLSAIDHMG